MTPRDLQSAVEKTGPYHWEIYYDGAECKFETPEEETGTIYHLEVPEHLRGQGIGTAMVELAIRTLKAEGVSEIHSQIRASGGATEHVFSKHLSRSSSPTHRGRG